MSVVGYFMLEDLKKDKEFSAQRVAKRLEQGTDRKDFMSPILTSVPSISDVYSYVVDFDNLRANNDKGMSVPEIESSFNIIIVAGMPSPASQTHVLSC